jgi:hypothetical protein
VFEGWCIRILVRLVYESCYCVDCMRKVSYSDCIVSGSFGREFTLDWLAEEAIQGALTTAFPSMVPTRRNRFILFCSNRRRDFENVFLFLFLPLFLMKFSDCFTTFENSCARSYSVRIFLSQ